MAGTRGRLRLILPFISVAADAFRNRSVSASEHTCDTPAGVTDPTAIQDESDARRLGAGCHDTREAGTGTKFPTFTGESPQRIAINQSRRPWHDCRIKRTRGLEEMPWSGPMMLATTRTSQSSHSRRGVSRRYWRTSTSPPCRVALRTPRRGLHRRDGRAPGEATPSHRCLAVGGEQGVT